MCVESMTVVVVVVDDDVSYGGCEARMMLTTCAEVASAWLG